MDQNDSYQNWYAAYVKLLNDSKHGVQNKLAEFCEVSSKYISDLKLLRIRDASGRESKASPELQAKIAEFFNMSLETMIAYGNEILNPGAEAFPFFAEIMALSNHNQRALAITNAAATNYGLEKWIPKGLDFHLFPTMPGKCNKYVEDYLAGDINEKDLYEGLLTLFANIEFDLKRRLRKEKLTSG